MIARMATDREAPGPPWPLAENEIGQFAVDGVALETLETVEAPGGVRWRVQLGRPRPRVTRHDPSVDETLTCAHIRRIDGNRQRDMGHPTILAVAG